MYVDGELGLSPNFQRFFRWTDEQKSRLIESLLLGIPVPPIFVTERSDSKWDVIDGLQRLSTIFELMGVLKNSAGNTKAPLQLTKTHYLPAIDGRYWSNDQGEPSLTDSARIKIKRGRIDVNIIQSASDEDVKYEVFQRLNSGGSNATPQEVRNCLLVMHNADFFQWMEELAARNSFRECLLLTDRSLEEAFDMELLSRYLVFTKSSIDDLQGIDELSAFLNDRVTMYARDSDFPLDTICSNFTRVFNFLSESLGFNSFRRYDADRGKYTGPMLVSLFEVIACGLAYSLESGLELPSVDEFQSRHRDVWNELSSKPFVGSGIRASTRIPETIRYGRNWAAG